MKILVLMPLDEQHVPAATAIYEYLPKEIRDICFSLPMYMQYLMSTKLERTWEECCVRTLFDSQKLLDVLKPQDDYILIGNTAKKYKFDNVFNFQDIEKAQSYKDVFLEKIRQIFGHNDPIIDKLIYNLHENKESSLALINCRATADFLTDYINAGSFSEQYDFKKIKEKYDKEILKKYDK